MTATTVTEPANAPRLIMRGNSMVRLVRRRLVRRWPKADPWAVYDDLPAPIRAVLQEGPVQLCPIRVLAELRRCRRYGFDETEAAARVASLLASAHLRNIARAEPWQPPSHGRRKPLPSPHMLARASMQTSGRLVP